MAFHPTAPAVLFLAPPTTEKDISSDPTVAAGRGADGRELDPFAVEPAIHPGTGPAGTAAHGR